MTQYIAINNEQDQTFKLEHPSGSGAITVTSKEIYDAIHPRTLTETATFTGIDNKIVMTGIVPALALEVGDVIQISNALEQNNKPRTVESITDNNTIIVNYEHAGNRGNGSLKLADQTANVTIKRIAKWFNAPIGLGQAWVNVSQLRLNSVSYTNDTGRAITVSAMGSTSKNSNAAGITVDGLEVEIQGNYVTSGQSGYYSSTASAIIPLGSVYEFTTTSVKTIHELR